jgi:undecaprenyl-diphosphatase
MIDYLIAAFLGFLQGITEFFPVSSSGHLVLSQSIFEHLGYTLPSDDVFFDVLLHLGSLTIVLIYFRHEITQFLFEWTGFGTPHPTSIPAGSCRMWTGYVLLSTFITAALALPFEDRIGEAFNSPLLVGFCLLFTGALLTFTWWMDRKRTSPTEGKIMSWSMAAGIGLAQAVAVLPGVSRSGATIAIALLLGARRSEAVTFSFLLSIPAILGGALLTARKVDHIHLGTALVGILMAMLAGWFALGFLVRLVVKGKLLGFATYCVVLGLLAVILCW